MEKIGTTDSGNILVELSPEEWSHIQEIDFNPQELSIRWHVTRARDAGLISVRTANAVFRGEKGHIRDGEYYPGVIENMSFREFVSLIKRGEISINHCGVVGLQELGDAFLVQHAPNKGLDPTPLLNANSQ